MPRANNTKTTENNGSAKTPDYIKLDSYEIVDVREYSKDGKSWHNATVRINGVTIYGCRAVTYTDTQDGKEKDFLSFPQRQGSDGKWYRHVSAALSPEDQQKICDAIWAKLDGK